MQECCWGIIDQILPPGPERKGQSVSQSAGRPVKDVPGQIMQGKKREERRGQEVKRRSALLIGCIALQIGKETGGEIGNRRQCRNSQTERQTDQMAATETRATRPVWTPSRICGMAKLVCAERREGGREGGRTEGTDLIFGS